MLCATSMDRRRGIVRVDASKSCCRYTGSSIFAVGVDEGSAVRMCDPRVTVAAYCRHADTAQSVWAAAVARSGKESHNSGKLVYVFWRSFATKAATPKFSLCRVEAVIK